MSEVKSPKYNTNLHYVKTKPIDWKTLEKNYVFNNSEEEEYKYNPFSIQKIQNYNPIYNHFFELNEKNYDKISLNHRYHFQNTNLVLDIENDTIKNNDVFIKYSPLLDPYRYMTGKYKEIKNLTTLPKPPLENLSKKEEEKDDESPLKLSDPNNASYVDNFFSFLASRLIYQYKYPHSVDYYGSFLGIQHLFKVNIADDIEFLQSSDYYLENNRKLFYVVKGEDDPISTGSRANKNRLNLASSYRHNFTVISLGEPMVPPIPLLSNEQYLEEGVSGGTIGSPDGLIYEKDMSNVNDKDSSSESDSDSSESESCSEKGEDELEEDELKCSESDESEVESDDDSDNYTDFSEDVARYAYIKDFPIQLICLEKCDGTMDELFMKKQMTEQKGASALFQVIMILLTYQKLFQFTHNDLHTNNIMYSETYQEFLYYKWNGNVYKVPTYGKIFKIIDFGRSIYRYNGRIFCSDSFATGGDASTQYNTEPYFNEDKPRIDPNYSFDLCRLGCSIYDFIIDDDEPRTVAGFNELQKTIHRWCINDFGKNVLYKKNGEERYPGFKLYRMIAKTVHKHTPEEQLKYPFFNQFLYKNKKNLKNLKIVDIDAM